MYYILLSGFNPLDATLGGLQNVLQTTRIGLEKLQIFLCPLFHVMLKT